MIFPVTFGIGIPVVIDHVLDCLRLHCNFQFDLEGLVIGTLEKDLLL
ncbi:hypothetical protein A2U01_0086223 [Trifolium medium]|uniref:Uncharacterized protein n=1 Tax=Trifolium medium TaxID=97028 RepID=A0A392TYJ2_9FABA|nr:hypothetical protein [Trifolium medium]